MVTPSQLLQPEGNKLAPAEPQSFFDVEARSIRAGYRGVFARQDIPAGAVVFMDGGMVIRSPHQLPPDQFGYQSMIGPNVYLSPTDFENMHPIWFLNHSCDSNLQRLGGLVYISRRRIAAGEELTVDYSAFVAQTQFPWHLDCACGAAPCRKRVTPDDWKDSRIAALLWSEFLPFVQRAIMTLGILKPPT